jgi:hypothetical protein
MSATAAIAELLQEAAEWRQFYRQCCETGALRLRAQAWQFRDELRRRGAWFELEEVEDALMVIARKVLPETSAAQWDPGWANEHCRDALAKLQERYAGLSAEEREALDFSGQDIWDERMHAAGVANDPATFREALKGWERTAVGALEAAKERSGAA